MGRKLAIVAMVAALTLTLVAWQWPARGWVKGQVQLQGLSGGKSWVTVCGKTVPTSWDGRFYLACPPGTWDAKAGRPSFLSAVASVEVQAGEVTYLGPTTLLGGDVYPDEKIDSTDTLVVLTYLGQPTTACGEWWTADVNRDGIVDSTDLLYSVNWQLSDTLQIVGPLQW